MLLSEGLSMNTLCKMKVLTASLILYSVVGSIFSADLGHHRRGVVLEHCPNGSTRHDSSCYIASHLLANWPDALVYCQAYAGHLAFINNDREQHFMAAFVKGISASSTDPAHYFWIGGTDAMSEGEWIWAGTLEPVTYTNWSPGNPNNADGHPSHHQDCMAIYGSTGLWDDGYCETTHNFICEIELDVETSIIG